MSWSPDISPIGIGASLHLGTAISNFGIQETLTHPKETRDVFDYEIGFEDGYLHARELPGHGVDFNEAAAEKYPYQASNMAISRLEDGSMWHW